MKLEEVFMRLTGSDAARPVAIPTVNTGSKPTQKPQNKNKSGSPNNKKDV